MNKTLILSRVKDAYKFQNDKELSSFLGISNQTLSNWRSRNSIDYDVLFTKCESISADWLLTGKGSMLRDQEEKQTPVLVPAVGSSEGIPLIPLDAMAGYAQGGAQILELDCERFIVPTFKGADYLITVKGSSMNPKYNSGDIVACKNLPLSDIFFQWNKVYVIDTVQGPLIKRVEQGTDDGSIQLISENPKYKPFTLRISEINAIALVIGVIRLE